MKVMAPSGGEARLSAGWGAHTHTHTPGSGAGKLAHGAQIQTVIRRRKKGEGGGMEKIKKNRAGRRSRSATGSGASSSAESSSADSSSVNGNMVKGGSSGEHCALTRTLRIELKGLSASRENGAQHDTHAESLLGRRACALAS